MRKKINVVLELKLIIRTRHQQVEKHWSIPKFIKISSSRRETKRKRRYVNLLQYPSEDSG